MYVLKMNLLLYFCCLLGIHQAITQAVTIQPAVPAVGMLQASQLWNISAINTTSLNQVIRIDLMVIDRITGQQYLTGESVELSLKPGATLLNGNMVGPIKYAPAGFFINLSGREFLPVGQYTLCYNLYGEVNKNLVPISKEYIPVDIEPMTPPYLNYPFHQSAVSEKNPRFLWIPPTPSQLFSALQYDFLLVEKQPEQTPEEAVQRNTPLMTIGNLATNSFGYNGVGMSALDTGKQYAWQVIAKNGAAYGVKSEVWSFVISKSESIGIVKADYLLMNSDFNNLSPFYTSYEIVYVKYSSSKSADKLILQIEKDDGKVIRRSNVSVFPGDNYFKVKLDNKIKPGVPYMLYLIYNKEILAGSQIFRIAKDN